MKKYKIEYPSQAQNPAWLIPLSDEELRLLGELCAIQGQMDFIMQMTVMVLRGVKLPKARKLLGSPNMSANARVWLETIERKSPRRDMKALARAVVDEIEVIRHGRNDFVHGFFAHGEEGEGFSLTRHPGHYTMQGQVTENRQQPAVAVHNLKKVPVGNLKAIRDKAAALTLFMDHIYMRTGGLPGTEPHLPDLIEDEVTFSITLAP